MIKYEDALLTQVLGNLLTYSKQYNHKLTEKIGGGINFNSKWIYPSDTLLQAMRLSYKSKIACSVNYTIHNYYGKTEEGIYTYDLHKELSLIGTRIISLLERINKKFKILSKIKDCNIMGQIYHMFRCYLGYCILQELLRERINIARREAGLKENKYNNINFKIGE